MPYVDEGNAGHGNPDLGYEVEKQGGGEMTRKVVDDGNGLWTAEETFLREGYELLGDE